MGVCYSVDGVTPLPLNVRSEPAASASSSAGSNRPRGVHLVISDAHAGLNAAVAQQFSGSSRQRCRMHLMRNLHGAVSAKHAPAVTAAVKTIFAHTDPAEVADQWDRVADTLAPGLRTWRRN